MKVHDISDPRIAELCQLALQAKGLYRGKIDGIYGYHTEAAFVAYCNLSKMPISQRSLDVIAALKTEVQPLALAFLSAVAAAGVLPPGCTVQIISGTRSYAQQHALYVQPHDGIDNNGNGRIDEPAEFVTKADAGYSLHNFGIAFDVGIFDSQGKYIDEVLPNTDAQYAKLAPFGRQIGLEWGGDWTGTFKDFPHYQYNPAHLTLEQMRGRTAAGKSLFSS